VRYFSFIRFLVISQRTALTPHNDRPQRSRIITMNVLCATRCIVFENRWNLLMAAAAVGLGYLIKNT
jgi:hypothetical protein